ncbi:MAG: hypothetical protein R3F40_15935 [Candidatus Competibacteraceae bacterium]
MATRFVVAAGWIVLVPTFLLGAAFPAALRLTAEPASSGRDTGRVLAECRRHCWHPAGGICPRSQAWFGT